MLLAPYSEQFDGFINNKIQQFHKVSSNYEMGRKLVLQDELSLPGFTATPAKNFADWEANPFNNRSWLWKLHWFAFLPGLIAYFERSKDWQALELAAHSIKSWISRYLHTDNLNNEFVWHDHGTALRGEQLVLFYYYCEINCQDWLAKNTDLVSMLQSALIKHAEKLSDAQFYSANTNHGLEQARVLLLLSIVLPGTLSANWQQLAITRISAEFQHAFTEEGVHVENSPAYHVFVFKVFINIVQGFGSYFPATFIEQFFELGEKALIFITHILRPDGTLPAIGDTEQLASTDGYFQAFKQSLNYKNTLYALRMGKQGIKPTQLNRVFVRSGYAIFRTHWPEPDNVLQPLQLIVKAGSLSHYHYQQDEGHISCFAAGEDWLIDSGLYNYNENSEIRRYMRSRQAHNVALFEHSEDVQPLQQRFTNWAISDQSEDDITPSVTIALDVVENIRQLRTVSLNATLHQFTVEDSIICKHNKPEDITLQWHCPADKTLCISGNQIAIHSPSGNTMFLTISGDTPDNIEVKTGSVDGKIYSFQSLKSNTGSDSQVLLIHYNNRHSVNTRCSFALTGHK